LILASSCKKRPVLSTEYLDEAAAAQPWKARSGALSMSVSGSRCIMEPTTEDGVIRTLQTSSPQDEMSSTVRGHRVKT
jgi:hypothetical protein